MQQEYKITIKNERYNHVWLFQIIFLAVIAIIFGIASYYENNIFGLVWPVLLCFSIFFALNQADFARYKFFRMFNFVESAFLWAIAGSILLLTWWMAALVIIIAVI
ncbi:MAG: hypothetical protein ABI861_12045, partial [Panacibacter sp.]